MQTPPKKRKKEKAQLIYLLDSKRTIIKWKIPSISRAIKLEDSQFLIFDFFLLKVFFFLSEIKKMRRRLISYYYYYYYYYIHSGGKLQQRV